MRRCYVSGHTHSSNQKNSQNIKWPRGSECQSKPKPFHKLRRLWRPFSGAPGIYIHRCLGKLKISSLDSFMSVYWIVCWNKSWKKPHVAKSKDLCMDLPDIPWNISSKLLLLFVIAALIQHLFTLYYILKLYIIQIN